MAAETDILGIDAACTFVKTYHLAVTEILVLVTGTMATEQIVMILDLQQDRRGDLCARARHRHCHHLRTWQRSSRGRQDLRSPPQLSY